MESSKLKQAVLDLVLRPGYTPIKPRAIARRLGLGKNEAADLKRVVKKLVRKGRLAYMANHLVAPPAPASEARDDRVTGIFRRTARGFGFVRPRGVATATTDTGEPPPDIYIPARRTGDAATGDLVLVKLKKGRPGRRDDGEDFGPRGEIVEIIERETHQFVGTYLEMDGSAYVEVDGGLFLQPIHVGDPHAKNVRSDDKVVFEMLRFPSSVRDGEGVITEVLGPAGKPGVDTLSIMREFDLPDRFGEDVLDDARQQAETFEEQTGEDAEDGRTDLTGETILTIDPADARDFDDAISLERLDNGHWRLGVHIADVSYFVRPKTALDREAYSRATSVYLPDRVIPMLPEIISNGLASLQPGVVRFAKTAVIELTADGACVATDVYSSRIKSSKRLAYEQVDQFLENRKPWRKKLGAKVFELLERMHELAMILRKRRFRRGSLQLDMPEVKIDLDRDGRVSGAHVTENTESHQIIEEFMLAANEAVAERLRDAAIPFLRRIHASPTPKKLKLLTEFVREIGLETESLESRFALQKLLDRVVGRPEHYAVHYAALRSLQRAEYSPVDDGHYALASDCYCHFTSPIRRYPDLTIHRLIDCLLGGVQPREGVGELVVSGEHCSDRERRAEAAERELTRLKLLEYLSHRIGEEMDGVVTGVERFGLFVRGVEIPAEGLVHVDSLTDDTYRYDRAAHCLTGYHGDNMFRLGDSLRVAVARVDLNRRQLDFRLIGRAPRPPRDGKPGRAKKARPATKKTRATKKTARPATKKTGGAKKKPRPAKKKTGGAKKKTRPAKKKASGRKRRR